MPGKKQPQIRAIQADEAPSETIGILDEVRQVYDLPTAPPLYRSVAHSPTVLAGTWKLSSDIMERGELAKPLKQLIFLSVSSARGCEYCETIYSALCKVNGLGEEQIRAAAHNPDDLDPIRTRDMVTFAVKVAMEPDAVTDADYARMRSHGLSESELLELIATAATATYFNILATGMRVDVDDAIRDMLSP